MSSHIKRSALRWTGALAILALVASCQSDGSNPAGPNDPPTDSTPGTPKPLTSGSVVVTQAAVLLTGVGQSRTLSASTLNDAGAPVSAALTWTSSAPDRVAIDANGRLEARAIGSAQVFASSGSYRSQPVFVVVAEPQAGALLVSDAQVVSVGPPLGLAPGEVPGAGTQYEVRLTGVATPPSPGTVVLASGNAPVSGKVAATRVESGVLVVTLAMAPLPELLARYDINWSIDLNAFPAVLAAGGAGGAARARTQVAPFVMPPGPSADIINPFTALDCEASLAPVLLDRKVQLTPTADLRLDFEETPGHSKRVLVGTEKLVGMVSVKLNAGFKFSGKCTAQVLIRIPIGGPLAVGVMPGVRFGIGAGLEGQLLVTAGELSVTGEVGVSHSIGWECGGATLSCTSIEQTTPVNEFKPKFEVFNPVTGMRVEVSGQFYVLVGLDAVFGTVYSAGVLEARIGPVQSVDLGFEEDQAINPSYASKYDLKLEAVIEPASGLQQVLSLISPGVGLTFQTKFSQPISESPKGVLNVSQHRVGLGGGTVDMTVNLSNTDYFLLGYNVERVELWQKRATESDFKVLRSFTVNASNQTVFTHTWQPTTDDLGENEFAVFVYTQFPVPGLEIADNSIQKVEVSCFSAGPRVIAAGAPNTCSDTWVGSGTFVSDELTADVTVTWIRDPDTPEIDGDVFYIATGTATLHWPKLEAQGCSISQHVFPLAENNLASWMLIEYGESPPIFSGSAVAGGVVTIACPNEEPGDYPQFVAWFIGVGTLSGNGTIIDGTNGSGGVTWTWHFSRP